MVHQRSCAVIRCHSVKYDTAMKPTRYLPVVPLLGGLLAALTACDSQHPYGRQVDNLTSQDMWDKAPLVAVGYLSSPARIRFNVRETSPVGEVIEFNACEATMTITNVLKGQAHQAKSRYLWFTPWRSCPAYWPGRDGPWEAVRIWFLRPANGLMRPVTDAGRPFLQPNEKLDLGPQDLIATKERQETFGRVLLNPANFSTGPSTHTSHFLQFAPLACSLLGDIRCLEELRQLQPGASSGLKQAICLFLSGGRYHQCARNDCLGLPGNTFEREILLQRRKLYVGGMQGSMDQIMNALGTRTRADLVDRLKLLACETDPMIRGRARELLKSLTPSRELELPCVPCNEGSR